MSPWEILRSLRDILSLSRTLHFSMQTDVTYIKYVPNKKLVRGFFTKNISSISIIFLLLSCVKCRLAECL